MVRDDKIVPAAPAPAPLDPEPPDMAENVFLSGEVERLESELSRLTAELEQVKAERDRLRELVKEAREIMPLIGWSSTQERWNKWEESAEAALGE